MNETLRPTEGARYLLTLIRDGDTQATYTATIFVPDAEFTAQITLHDDGTVVMPELIADAAHTSTMQMFARLLARGAAARTAGGLAKWPARQLRWRGPGRGA